MQNNTEQVQSQINVKPHLIKSFPPTLHPLSVSVFGMDPEMLLKGTATKRGSSVPYRRALSILLGKVAKRDYKVSGQGLVWVPDKQLTGAAAQAVMETFLAERKNRCKRKTHA